MSQRERLAFTAILLATACSANPAPVAPATKDVLTMRIHTTEDANGGTALHVLVRETTKADYPRLDYEAVANTLQAESDPKTLEWIVVLPGQTKDVEVDRPPGAAVGVYFLFTEPGRHWKELVEDATVRHVEFFIGRDQIKEARARANAAGSQ